MADLADMVAELIVALGYPKMHVHGTSFGAVVGMTLAARHPQLVDRVVLSCFLARYDNAARMMRATWKRCAADSGMAAVADLTSVAGFGRAYFDRPEAAAQFASMREAFCKTTPEAFIAAVGAIERSDLSLASGRRARGQHIADVASGEWPRLRTDCNRDRWLRIGILAPAATPPAVIDRLNRGSAPSCAGRRIRRPGAGWARARWRTRQRKIGR